MKFLNLTMLLATIVVIPVAQAADNAGNAEAGKAKAAVCAACHGPDGNSPSGQFPNLAGQGAPYLLKQLHDFKSGARVNAIMQGQVANLSDQDMKNLAAYFSSQTVHPGQADPKLVAQGEKLFRGGDPATGVPACSGCHNPAGQGVDAARFPALAGQHPEYVESQLRAFRAAGRGDLGSDVVTRENDPSKMMETIAAKLSDQQILAVASFVSGLSAGKTEGNQAAE